MICDEKQGAIRIGRFDIFDAEDIHQIVSRDINPERADMSLAKCPEALPGTLIHPTREAKPQLFHSIEHADLRLVRKGRLSDLESVSGRLGGNEFIRHTRKNSVYRPAGKKIMRSRAKIDGQRPNVSILYPR